MSSAVLCTLNITRVTSGLSSKTENWYERVALYILDMFPEKMSSNLKLLVKELIGIS